MEILEMTEEELMKAFPPPTVPARTADDERFDKVMSQLKEIRAAVFEINAAIASVSESGR